MSPNDFRKLIAERTDAELLGPCLREDQTPYVFEPRPNSWADFRAEVSGQLRVSPDGIRIVGSGRFGFSLRPHNNLKAYTEKSDIDVVVVDTVLFDSLWDGLLSAAYPGDETSPKLGGWLSARRREVYAGWLDPLEIKLDPKIWGPAADRVLNFSTDWFNIFQKASKHPPRRHETVTGRLYRTWRHADLYHLHSLATLRITLAE